MLVTPLMCRQGYTLSKIMCLGKKLKSGKGAVVYIVPFNPPTPNTFKILFPPTYMDAAGGAYSMQFSPDPFPIPFLIFFPPAHFCLSPAALYAHYK